VNYYQRVDQRDLNMQKEQKETKDPITQDPITPLFYPPEEELANPGPSNKDTNNDRFLPK